MCRRCGEPDGRGPAHQRRKRKQWLLSPESLWGGDGEKVQCWNYDNCGTWVAFDSMEVDRIIPGWQCRICGLPRPAHPADADHAFHGGTYRMNNVRPSCGPCNRDRNRGNPWGHAFGPEVVRIRRGFPLRCMTR